MSRLPGILGEIEDVTDTVTALKLARARGGTEMTFSGRADGALAQIVGPEAAAKIAELLGGGRFIVPMANARGARARRAVAAQLLAAGHTSTETALAADVHLRTVERLKHKQRGDQNRRQGSLFDD